MSKIYFIIFTSNKSHVDLFLH